MNPDPQLRSSQSGMALIEAMVAVLVFAVGVLAMIGMQTLAVKTASDAKYRADAAYLANQLIGQMWTADRISSSANFIRNYAYNCSTAGGCAPADASGPICAWSGGSNGNTTPAAVTAWLAQLTILPNASSSTVMVSVVPNAPIFGTSSQPDYTYQVAIAICWQLPQDKAASRFHQYVTYAQIS
jgi:type IV pilus assembly protein PilV